MSKSCSVDIKKKAAKNEEVRYDKDTKVMGWAAYKILCPYCQSEDISKLRMAGGHCACRGCGKRFQYMTMYSVWRDCKLNGEEHDVYRTRLHDYATGKKVMTTCCKKCLREIDEKGEVIKDRD